mmetsp:Transcript_8187/g.22207  ORF Transcript_8187/g.22207 Transcript_8187/m.22207 type:complete len:271 (-) Transcript_8187:1243-2055(-)
MRLQVREGLLPGLDRVRRMRQHRCQGARDESTREKRGARHLSDCSNLVELFTKNGHAAHVRRRIDSLPGHGRSQPAEDRLGPKRRDVRLQGINHRHARPLLGNHQILRRAPNERRRRARHHRHADRVCVCQLAVWPQGPHQALDRVVHAKLRGDNWTHCTAVDEYTSIIRQGIRWERPALLKAVLDHHRWLHHGDLDEPREATHTRVLDGSNFIFRHRVEWSRSGRRGAVRGRQVVEVARGNSRGKTRADSLRMKWRTRAYDECINANAG